MIHFLLISETEVGFDFNLALLFGLIVLGGTFGARLFQKFHIPQVVGCIIVGILLGDVFNLITPPIIESLEPFTMFALGIIGFMIGGELHSDVFKKYGKQFFIILFSQGIGAFVLVAIGSSVVAWFFTHNIYISIAVGIVLGAIGSATAPAATVNVLWEYKTRGPLTTAVLAIVALDDALALLLYRAAATGAKALIGTGGDNSILKTTSLLLGEIIGAILLGFLAGVVLYFLLKFVVSEEKILDFAIASLLLIVGISMIPGIDPILPAMTLGITMANLAPRESKSLFNLVKKFSPPIYISFFVLAGAHMEFGSVTGWMLLMIVVYILARAAGKVFGSWLGAEYCGAALAVRKYLGICLLPQAGVAIGLGILAGKLFDIGVTKALSHIIIMVVMLATFVMEILGPMCVKVGVKKAGEIGLNITEEDLIKTYKVGDVMDKDIPVISSGMLLNEVIQIVSNTSNFYYTVIDSDKKPIGAITLDGIRNTFETQELNDWLVALDIMEPLVGRVTSGKALADSLEKANKLDVEFLPVVDENRDGVFVGVLGARAVHRKLAAEVLARQREADSMYGTVVS
ncbi:MAG: cation:proton antiporter domain-containing protein [Planctomycetota bacterium]|jgi:Kef-type K+ transport system membrane component KefB